MQIFLLGNLLVTCIGYEKCEAGGFEFLAPTTRRNALRVLRAMQLPKPGMSCTSDNFLDAHHQKLSPKNGETLCICIPSFWCFEMFMLLNVVLFIVLLEGSPGVGKTSLIVALGKYSGHKVVRINLSEQVGVSFYV